jgi:hypothetical protein
MRIVIENIIFLGTSPEEVVNSDSAISQMEAISSQLRNLTESERQSFVNYIGSYIGSIDSSDDERIDFLTNLSDNIGLA